MAVPERKRSITRQAELVNISRGNVYDLREPNSTADLALMRRISELYMNAPFAGPRILRDMRRREGHSTGRKLASTLMAKMGIEALYRKSITSNKHPEHKIYPYLFRAMTIDRSNQACAMDITYIPMDARYRVEAVAEAIAPLREA